MFLNINIDKRQTLRILKLGFEAVLDDYQFKVMDANFEPSSFIIKKGRHSLSPIFIVDTGEHLFANVYSNFRKNSKRFHWNTQGPGGTDSWKNLSQKFHVRLPFKRQCHEIFDFWFFSWISFPQAPENTITAISNFFKHSRRYLRLKVHHQCCWHRWQMEKSSIRKILIILFRHLWVVELT